MGESTADGAAMLVIDDAGRLVHDLPSAFPCKIAEVCVLQIKRREKRIETAELQEFAAVEGAGAAAAISARVEIADGRVSVMPDSKTALLPSMLR